MQSSNSNLSGIQDMLGNTIKNVASTSLAAYKPLLDGLVNNMSILNKSLLKGQMPEIKLPKVFKETCNCCPPECECPPHCIAAINRTAAETERIVVPFMIKNNCSHAKTYRVGIRPLTDQDGKPAPSQPTLSKQAVTLEPGKSERVLMSLDLNNFNNGSTYTTEIVLREKEFNQNICFTLLIDNDHQLVSAEPKDEKKYKLHWQSWQSHYYCEPNKQRLDTTTHQ